MQEQDILLNDILHLSDEELKNTRIRFNMYNGETNPIDEFLKNPDNLLGWNYWNSKSYRLGQIAIGFVKLNSDEWLLFTIGRITKIIALPKGERNIGYEAEPIEKYKKYFGRLIIKYHNKDRQTFKIGTNVINDIKISRILESFYDGIAFPGYEKVCLSYEQLELVVKGKDQSYRNALEKQKAVYVLTDTATGKLYVGSATSDKGMLLDRWSSYIYNCNGGNKQLIELTNNEGVDYFKKNFQFSIIEHYDMTVSDKYILEREKYWKKVLNTVDNGYNSNW